MLLWIAGGVAAVGMAIAYSILQNLRLLVFAQREQAKSLELLVERTGPNWNETFQAIAENYRKTG